MATAQHIENAAYVEEPLCLTNLAQDVLAQCIRPLRQYSPRLAATCHQKRKLCT